MASITFDEAMLILERKGPVLETAREVSQILVDHALDGAIIGGVAVGLHGHKRSTIDVDVFLENEVARFAELLKINGYRYDRRERQFLKSRVPVHIVTAEEIGQQRVRLSVIDGILTVTLADLMNIKLRSGLNNVLRAKDLGDVIDLIRANRLGSDFAAKLDKPLRADFRKFVRAIQREQKGSRQKGPRNAAH